MAVCALSMLDGLGNEVTALGGVVILLLAMSLAWLSTHVADRGDHILGTILTVGAHASLIGLGGHDDYVVAPSSAESGEQQSEETEEDKQEEDDEEEDGSEELLDIQGDRKKMRRENEDTEDDEDEGTSITVRLKFLNDTEELAVLKPQDTVGKLKRKYFAGRERQVKLIYQGQLLKEPRRTLLSLNITHNSVLHCHICQAQSPALPQDQPDDEQRMPARVGIRWSLRSAALAFSTGGPVVPVFVVLLATLWYLRLNYRYLFTAPATVSLVGVTCVFSFLVFQLHNR